MIQNATTPQTYKRTAPDPTDFKTASGIRRAEDPYREAKKIRTSDGSRKRTAS